MRISDWSSDVCSSDLVGFSTLLMAEAFPNSRFTGYDFHAPSIEQAAAHAQAHGLADRVAFKRSEEHTSELQSLMRISYAVFCLKKKKEQKKEKYNLNHKCIK